MGVVAVLTLGAFADSITSAEGCTGICLESDATTLLQSPLIGSEKRIAETKFEDSLMQTSGEACSCKDAPEETDAGLVLDRCFGVCSGVSSSKCPEGFQLFQPRNESDLKRFLKGRKIAENVDWVVDILLMLFGPHQRNRFGEPIPLDHAASGNQCTAVWLAGDLATKKTLDP